MSKKYKVDKSLLCAEIDRSSFTTKQWFLKQEDYCLETCDQCKELEILKKIMWELRRLNKKT